METGEDLLQRLQSLGALLRRSAGCAPVRLLVIDSVASAVRYTEDQDVVHRAQVLFAITGLLRRFAHEHELAVVVTNQVVDVLGAPRQRHRAATAGAPLVSGGREVTPPWAWPGQAAWARAWF